MGRSHLPPCPLARKAACSPCGYRDLIVLPRREETGELSSECILELAEKNIWERKLTSETNIPLYQLFFSLSVAEKKKIIMMCQIDHHSTKSPFYGAKYGGSVFQCSWKKNSHLGAKAQRLPQESKQRPRVQDTSVLWREGDGRKPSDKRKLE